MPNTQALNKGLHYESSSSDILDLLSAMLCRKCNFFFFLQKTEEEACCKRCYLRIWLSKFVLCRIITQSRVDTNVPQCRLQRLLKEGSLTCLLNSPQRKLLAFRSRDLCQLRCKSKLRFCFCTSSVGLFSRPLAQLNMLVTNHKLKYVSVGKVVFG